MMISRVIAPIARPAIAEVARLGGLFSDPLYGANSASALRCFSTASPATQKTTETAATAVSEPQSHSESLQGENGKTVPKENEAKRTHGNQDAKITREEDASGYFSKRRRALRKEAMDKSLKKGYFHDINEVTQNKGKVIMGTRALIPVTVANTMPKMEVESLTDKKLVFPDVFRGRVTLLQVSFRDFGYKMFPAWQDEFKHAFRNRKVVQNVVLSVTEDWIWSWFKSPIRNNLKKLVPPERHEMEATFFGPAQALREALGVTNLLTGYICLVDHTGKVRWRAAGEATEMEVKYMLRCTDYLIGEASSGGRHRIVL